MSIYSQEKRADKKIYEITGGPLEKQFVFILLKWLLSNTLYSRSIKANLGNLGPEFFQSITRILASDHVHSSSFSWKWTSSSSQASFFSWWWWRMWIDGSTTLKRNETEAIKKKAILYKDYFLKLSHMLNALQI